MCFIEQTFHAWGSNILILNGKIEPKLSSFVKYTACVYKLHHLPWFDCFVNENLVL